MVFASRFDEKICLSCPFCFPISGHVTVSGEHFSLFFTFLPPNGEGLLALKHFFLRTVKEPSSKTLLRVAELVLTLDCFSFADGYYTQINGVAMGTKIGPSYANLFVAYIEH